MRMTSHLATRDDMTEINNIIQNIDRKVTATDERVDGVEHDMLQMREDMERFRIQATQPRIQPRPPRRSTGSSSSTSRRMAAPKITHFGRSEADRLQDDRRHNEAPEVDYTVRDIPQNERRGITMPASRRKLSQRLHH